MWSARVQIARDRIEEARAEGRFDDSDTLLWRGARGYWLNKGGKVAESRRIMESAANTWSERVGPDDTWSTYASLLAASATIREVAGAAAAGKITPQDRARAATAAERIISGLPIFSGSREGNNVHHEVVEALVVAYSPLLLDRPADRETYEQQMSRWEND